MRRLAAYDAFRERYLSSMSRSVMRLSCECGRPQEEQRMAMGISRCAFTNVVKGRTVPELQTVVAMADYYGVGLDEMIGREVDA